jgi:hypothetical protein
VAPASRHRPGTPLVTRLECSPNAAFLKPGDGPLVLGRDNRSRLGAERTIATRAPTEDHHATESIMSAISTPSVTSPLTTPRGRARARWALLAALVIGAAGGAGVSAGLVQSQVAHDVRTVFVPVPSDPWPPAPGNVQGKVPR